MADTTEHPPGQGEAPAPRRRVPVWAWVGGVALVGLLIVCLVVVAIVAVPSLLSIIRGEIPPEAAEAGAQPTVTRTPTEFGPTSTPAAVDTATREPTRDVPTSTPAATPTATREPTQDVPTSTPAATPTDTPMPTETPIPPGLPGNPVTLNDQWVPVVQELYGAEMALVPAGCFRMGSEDGEDDEQPVHEVCFEEPFWIDVYEVSNEQYGAAAGDCTEWSSGDEQPRVCTDWFDAKAHCESRGARLPTEAEWEYTARGPDGLVYPWGNDFIADNVVYSDNSGGRTWDVGSKPCGASWIGAFDLSGNVSEWVNDWLDAAYYSTLADGVVNPQGPGSGEFRVTRGGSWYAYSNYVRAAYRFWFDPSLKLSYFGFRCARSYSP